jgi:hypothetical protein
MFFLMDPINSWSDFTRFLYFLYHFYTAAPFSGTYTALSLPFLHCRSIFGHVYWPFFTVFTPPLHFRVRILAFLYRFYTAAPFSGTYTGLSLPFLLTHAIFGHVSIPIYIIVNLQVNKQTKIEVEKQEANTRVHSIPVCSPLFFYTP